MRERKTYFTKESVAKLKTRGRSFLAGFGTATALIYGPDAVHAAGNVFVVRAERSALSEARQNMSTISKKDLSITGEKVEKRNGVEFKFGGEPTNEADALGRIDYAETKFREAKVPSEVIVERIENIKKLINAHQPGHLGAKEAILEMDRALDQHKKDLKSKLRGEVESAFTNSIKGGGAWAVLIGAEGLGVYKRRQKKKEKISLTQFHVPEKKTYILGALPPASNPRR